MQRDDHVAIKAGAGPVANVTVSHNRFFQGHGVSIGSETNAGVENVLVTDLIMDGAGGDHQRVVRIKSDASRGGEVRNVTFENICARNPGRPLEFTAAEVGKARIQGRVTHFVIDGASAGTRTYQARHSGDSNYAALGFGNVKLSSPERSR